MSRTFDKSKNVIVGFTVLFKQNGDYILSYSKSPVTSWGEYEKSVEELVYESVKEYRKQEQEPVNIIFHLTKKPGKDREINSVKNALTRLGSDIKYGFVHLNSYAGYRIFDASDSSYVPYSGLKVNLSNRQSLIMLDGRVPNKQRTSIGTPSVLEVTIHKDSTVPKDEYQRIIDQVYSFATVNWRGVINAKTVPVTTNYSTLIARIIGELGTDNWDEIVKNKSLMEKAWFL